VVFSKPLGATNSSQSIFSRSIMKDEHARGKQSRRRCNEFRERGAAICVKDEKEEEVLLVTSKRDTGKWVVPGGGVEPGEDVKIAAIREVLEEAGVKGVIVRPLGVFVNEIDRNRTAVFVLRVSEEMHDWEDSRQMGRKRRWFPVAEARMLLGLHKQSQQAYLDCLKTPIVTTTPVEGSYATNGVLTYEDGLSNDQRVLSGSNNNFDTETR